MLRYGSSRLYPYLMTRVDIVPLLLKELPFHSLFRGSTEGGEHCHYLHQCIYYAHSSRGGGWRKEEPILALFKWSYRRLREKIEQGERSGDFLKFVQSCFAEVGRDYSGECADSPLAEGGPAVTPTTDTQPAVTPVTDTQRPTHSLLLPQQQTHSLLFPQQPTHSLLFPQQPTHSLLFPQQPTHSLLFPCKGP